MSLDFLFISADSLLFLNVKADLSCEFCTRGRIVVDVLIIDVFHFRLSLSVSDEVLKEIKMRFLAYKDETGPWRPMWWNIFVESLHV